MSSSTDLWTYRPDAALDNDLDGFTVEAVDGELGEVERSANEAGAGWLIVQSGGRLFGHRSMMIPAGEVDDVDLDTETVFLTLTRDEVEAAPAFDESRTGDDSYRAALADYYLTRPALEGLAGDPTAYRER